ncbi:hypothetical protein [Micromonospora tulbaghiae]
MEVLRDRVDQEPVYASELVGVLVAVGREDEAWQEALRHRRWLGGPQWQTLLERRAVMHPEEVIQPYRDLVEQAILNSADKRRYRRAVALLAALRAAYQAAEEAAAFGRYLAEMRRGRAITYGWSPKPRAAPASRAVRASAARFAHPRPLPGSDVNGRRR